MDSHGQEPDCNATLYDWRGVGVIDSRLPVIITEGHDPDMQAILLTNRKLCPHPGLWLWLQATVCGFDDWMYSR